MSHHVLEIQSDKVSTLFKMPAHPSRHAAEGTHSFTWRKKGDHCRWIGGPLQQNVLGSFQNSTFITRWDRSAEMADEAARTITLNDGDTVEVEDFIFIFHMPNCKFGQDPKFTAIKRGRWHPNTH